MKTLYKTLLVALVALFSFGQASADFRFGIKAGLNFNKLDYKNFGQTIQDPGNRTGWQAGVMAEFTVPIINLGMDASIMYARQNLDNVMPEGQEEVFQNKDFLDIPVNLKWKIGLPIVSNIIKPMIYTGPDFLIALNKKTIEEFKTKTCEVGWNLGIGVELLNHLQITGGYCFGLNSVAKYTGINAQDYKVKKNYWSLSAAYLF